MSPQPRWRGLSILDISTSLRSAQYDALKAKLTPRTSHPEHSRRVFPCHIDRSGEVSIRFYIVETSRLHFVPLEVTLGLAHSSTFLVISSVVERSNPFIYCLDFSTLVEMTKWRVEMTMGIKKHRFKSGAFFFTLRILSIPDNPLRKNRN